MTRLPLFCTASVFLLVSSFTPSLNARQAASNRITAAANVTLRETPSPGAAAVAQVPLGTELTDAGPAGMDKTWLRVRVTDGREGWLLSSLTRPLDSNWRWQTYDRIVADRLSRKGDGFPAALELIAFIDRVKTEYTDRDGRARIELARLQAMAAAFAAVPFKGERREPFKSWLVAQGPMAVNDEPGGRWMLADKSIWELHDRQESTAAADDIAWFAVTNGLGGECEGFLTCYLEWRNRLQGEYLRRQPAGQHAETAVQDVKRLADQLAAPAPGKSFYDFDKTRDCKNLSTSLDALTKAVQPARVPSRDGALTSLGTLRRYCQ